MYNGWQNVNCALVNANVMGHLQKGAIFGALNGLYFFQITLQSNKTPSMVKIFDIVNLWQSLMQSDFE